MYDGTNDIIALTEIGWTPGHGEAQVTKVDGRQIEFTVRATEGAKEIRSARIPGSLSTRLIRSSPALNQRACCPPGLRRASRPLSPAVAGSFPAPKHALAETRN